jgi:hypothetical protein
MSEPDDWGSTSIEPTLAYFADRFRELEVHWCVAGAVAANAYRDPRATTDLDLMVQIPSAAFARIAAALAADGWEAFRRSPESDYPDVVRLRHPRYFQTDLLLVKIAYQREALQRARATQVGSTRVWFLSPEDVIVHKLIAYRPRDRADVHEILRIGIELDRTYVVRWCEFWGVTQRWNELLAEAAS